MLSRKTLSVNGLSCESDQSSREFFIENINEIVKSAGNSVVFILHSNYSESLL